jgi:hypothetical protein
MKEFFKEGFKVREELLKNWPYMAQLKSWRNSKKHDFQSPNSTDIHSLKKIDNAKAYVMKYCSKDEKNDKIEGLMWSCNEELSNCRGGQTIIDSNIHDEFQSAIDKSDCKVYRSDYFSVFFLNVHELYKYECFEILKCFSDFLKEHFQRELQSCIT